MSNELKNAMVNNFGHLVTKQSIDEVATSLSNWEYLGANNDKVILLRDYCGCMEFVDVVIEDNELKLIYS